MATVPTPLRASAHHAYQSWTSTWYDNQNRRRTKRFGKVGEVPKRAALAQFEAWKSREWKAKAHVRNPSDPTLYTVRMLCESFYEHAKKIYRKHGKPTNHMAQVAPAMNWMIDLYGDRHADSIGAPDIIRLRDAMIEGGKRKGRTTTLSVSTINGRLRIIKRCFAWARSYGNVCRETAFDVSLAAPLQAGRCEATPPKDIKPVPQTVLDATLEHCPQTVRDMIEVQLLTGMRSGELCAMRPCDLLRDGKVWEYHLVTHKTEHHGKDRVVIVGPKAYEIVSRYAAKRGLTDPVFTPMDAHRERLLLSGFAEVMAYQMSRSTFKPGRAYTNDTYRNAIQRACDRAFDADGKRRAVRDFAHRWHPHQLRHNYATRIRNDFGIEAAANMLGHSSTSTTMIYAEQALKKMKEVAKKVG